MTDFFPFGTQYHRAPTPLPSEWEEDLKQIAAIGYTHVQFRPQWRWHERNRGQYVFEDLDRLFDLAHQNGLRVVLKPMLETAPDWVFDDLKGTRIGFHGVPITPMSIGSFYVGGWLPCFDNPEVAKAAAQFVETLTARYVNHPALWFYDAWNEPRSRPLGQCHCEHSVRSYQTWLSKRYGTVEQINERFGKGWASLESIRPPASAWDYTELFLWRQWAVDAIARQVENVVQAFKRVDRKRMVLAHVGFCSVLQDAACDASDDLLTSQVSDRFGTSYPVNLWPSQPVHHAEGDLISDWLRRVDNEYWCHEFYPNEGNWCSPPDTATLDRLIWMALAGGTAGFTFWQYRSERLGNESNGFGMREINGGPTPRSEVCDNIARVLKKHGRTLAGSKRPRSRIAVMYSRESDVVSRIEKMSLDQMDISLAVGTGDYPYKHMLKAGHYVYQMLGHSTDMIAPHDDLTGYELVHLSAMEMVDAEQAEILRQFVHRGGKLVIEYPFACRDEATWVHPHRPAHGLADMLGCVEGQRVVVKPNQPQTMKLWNESTVTCEHWRVDFELRGAQPIGWWDNGQIAATRHRYGNGEVITLGSSLSRAAIASFDNPALTVFDELLKGMSLEPAFNADRGVWMRTRTGPNGSVYFVFNLNSHQAGVTLPTGNYTCWHQTAGTTQDGQRLLLPANAVWIGSAS